MFRAYFGDLAAGRLTRLEFLGFLLLLSVLFALYGLGIAFGIGVAQYLIRGDLPAAQAYLIEHLGLPLLVLTALFVLAFGFAKFNLIAKRIRDMGLPGWWTLLAVYAAFGILSYALPSADEHLRDANQVRGIVAGLITFGLLLIPSGLFACEHPPHPVQTGGADTQ